MRILVTGGTGFIGSHSVRALRAAGHAVHLLARDPAKVERVFGADAPGATPGDMLDPEAVEAALAGCDAVLHAAALVSLRASEADRVLKGNVAGARNVVGGAVRRGLRVVHVSSVGALFRLGGPRVGPDSPVQPGRTAYARSKAEVEAWVRSLQAEGAPIHVSYPTGVVGPDDPGFSESNHGIRAMVRDAMIVTSGRFPLVDVRDVALAHLRMLESPFPSGRWIVGRHEFTWRELANLYDELTGRRLRRYPVPGALLRLAGRLGDLVKGVVDFDFPLTAEAMDFASGWNGADCSRTCAELGIVFRDPRETLADALRWQVRAGYLPARAAGRLAAA